jgi:DNA ligase-1
LLDELNRVSAVGAEGLMIRKPKSLYESCRSNTLLKVKPFQDAEGLVIGHKPGKKKHKGVLGAVVIRMSSGVEFDLGTGFSDEERRNPPKVGDMVTFRFTELTNDGKPKCTSFISVRDYE